MVTDGIFMRVLIPFENQHHLPSHDGIMDKMVNIEFLNTIEPSLSYQISNKSSIFPLVLPRSTKLSV